MLWGKQGLWRVQQDCMLLLAACCVLQHEGSGIRGYVSVHQTLAAESATLACLH